MKESDFLKQIDGIEKPLNKEQILREKFFSAWGSARDQFGVSNNHHMAEILYDSLYNSTSINPEDVVDKPGFDRMEHLTYNMDLGEHVTPSKEDFILAIKRAVTTDTKFNECLYAGSLDVLKELSEYGPIKIWTRGDVYGYYNKQSQKFFPGSHEQIKKSAVAGIGKLRKEIAEEKSIPRRDVIDVVAGEDKSASIIDIMKEFKKRGVKKVFILEDQLNNIQKAAQKAFEFEGVEFIPIWVRQGLGKNKTPKKPEMNLDDWVRDYNGVLSIVDVPAKIEELGIQENETGFIVDYDDVLSNDEKRKTAQFESIKKILESKGWLSI
jgi:hypothetical protein